MLGNTISAPEKSDADAASQHSHVITASDLDRCHGRHASNKVTVRTETLQAGIFILETDWPRGGLSRFSIESFGSGSWIVVVLVASNLLQVLHAASL